MALSGAIELLKKVWEVYVIRGDKFILRGQQKVRRAQKRFEAQLKIAGTQIDARFDASLAGLDLKVKEIIHKTVKGKSIKREALKYLK